MVDEAIAGFPAAPPGIAEWEDLLVRLELGPRAVRIALETIPSSAWIASVDPQRWNIAMHIAHLARREAEVGEWLACLRDGRPLPPWAVWPHEGIAMDVETGAIARDLQLFAERRARNFAVVQRRGLEVWDWRASHAENGELSVYQLLSALVRHDARHLARLRAALRSAV
jgi:hypothetical protein